jgi:hypothetical protein
MNFDRLSDLQKIQNNCQKRKNWNLGNCMPFVCGGILHQLHRKWGKEDEERTTIAKTQSAKLCSFLRDPKR